MDHFTGLRVVCMPNCRLINQLPAVLAGWIIWRITAPRGELSPVICLIDLRASLARRAITNFIIRHAAAWITAPITERQCVPGCAMIWQDMPRYARMRRDGVANDAMTQLCHTVGISFIIAFGALPFTTYLRLVTILKYTDPITI